MTKTRRRFGPALPVGFYARDPVRVARDLLGCVLESRIGDEYVAGRIVEVEAYLGEDDPAAHCFDGRRTDRTEVMYGPPGRVYVYFTYGMHWCMNAVTRPNGNPSAVLLRALEPLEGIGVMRRRRGRRPERQLCSGPAKLCQALGVTGAVNGAPLYRGGLRIRRGPPDVVDVAAGPRVGISRAADWPLRFGVRGSEWVSRPAL